MRCKVSFLPLFALLTFFIPIPVHAESTIYSWRDANGVLTYSNSPAGTPPNAQVVVRAEEPTPPGQYQSVEGALVGTTPPQMPERPPYTATQGEFAVQLVKELGLGEPTDAGQAADILAGLRIAPSLGQWLFDQPMTPELTTRLRRLTVAAADRGAISLTQEQALLAFDTTAALLNVDIPTPTDQDIVSYAPYPMTDMPPLVDFYQPAPPYYPYYVWTPIAGGFWWGDYFFPGFYVLNVGQFCDHYPRHYHDSNHRSASIDPGHISHHVRDHITAHRMGATPGMGTTPGTRNTRNFQGDRQGGRQEDRSTGGPAADSRGSSADSGRTASDSSRQASDSSRINRSPSRPVPSVSSTPSRPTDLRASRSTAPRTAMATRPANSYRSSFSPPSSRSRSYHVSSINPRSFNARPYNSRSYNSMPSRSMHRTTLPSTLNYRRAAGSAPPRPTFHGGTELMARAAGRASIGLGGMGGRGGFHSAGGSFHAGSSFHR